MSKETLFSLVGCARNMTKDIAERTRLLNKDRRNRDVGPRMVSIDLEDQLEALVEEIASVREDLVKVRYPDYSEEE